MLYSAFSSTPRAYPAVPVFLETLLIVGVTLIALSTAIVVLKGEVTSLSEGAQYLPVKVSVLEMQ